MLGVFTLSLALSPLGRGDFGLGRWCAFWVLVIGVFGLCLALSLGFLGRWAGGFHPLPSPLPLRERGFFCVGRWFGGWVRGAFLGRPCCVGWLPGPAFAGVGLAAVAAGYEGAACGYYAYDGHDEGH